MFQSCLMAFELECQNKLLNWPVFIIFKTCMFANKCTYTVHLDKWNWTRQSESNTRGDTESQKISESREKMEKEQDKSERHQSGLSLCSWQGVRWYMSTEKRWGPGTPKRQAPFDLCTQALFTTMNLTSKSNTFFFTPDTSSKQQFNPKRFHRVVCRSL